MKKLIKKIGQTSLNVVTFPLRIVLGVLLINKFRD